MAWNRDTAPGMGREMEEAVEEAKNMAGIMTKRIRPPTMGREQQLEKLMQLDYVSVAACRKKV